MQHKNAAKALIMWLRPHDGDYYLKNVVTATVSETSERRHAKTKHLPVYHASDESRVLQRKSAVGVGVGVQEQSQKYIPQRITQCCVGVIQWYTVEICIFYMHLS